MLDAMGHGAHVARWGTIRDQQERLRRDARDAMAHAGYMARLQPNDSICPIGSSAGPQGSESPSPSPSHARATKGDISPIGDRSPAGSSVGRVRKPVSPHDRGPEHDGNVALRIAERWLLEDPRIQEEPDMHKGDIEQYYGCRPRVGVMPCYHGFGTVPYGWDNFEATSRTRRLQTRAAPVTFTHTYTIISLCLLRTCVPQRRRRR